MSDGSTSVGIDAHKKDLQVAMLVSRATAPVTWTVANEPRAIARLWRKLEQQAAGPVVCCYEAGGCGYGLQRQLQRGRVQCQVIAPALSPRKAATTSRPIDAMRASSRSCCGRGC